MKVKKYFLFALNTLKDVIKFCYVKLIYKFPKVLTIEQTLDLILIEGKSFARYGDGEFNHMSNISIGFQDETQELAIRLKEVLTSKSKTCLICIPGSLHNLSGMKWGSQLMWMHLIAKFYKNYYSNFDYNIVYPNSLITRPYMDLSNKKRTHDIFQKLKKIWENKNIVIIEGEYTKLGVGNDLFADSNSVKRVVTVSKNAFDKYDELLEEIKSYSRENIILIALGPTATVLAYDLSTIGFQACDVGHIDIEYEWFLKQTLKKTPIKGKFVNEVSTNNPTTILVDENYEKQIIKRII